MEGDNHQSKVLTSKMRNSVPWVWVCLVGGA